METAICIRCGAKKKRPYHKCRSCGLDPKDDEAALVKSVYLSTGRCDDPDEAARYVEELQQHAAALRAGQEVEYDEHELRRLRRQKHLVESVPMSAVLATLFRFFLPAILLLAGMFALGLLLGWLREHL